MKLDEINKKLIKSYNDGTLIKILLVVVVGVIAAYPFFSIQSKLKEAMGNQPKLMLGSYIMIATLILIIGLSIILTRPKNK